MHHTKIKSKKYHKFIHQKINYICSLFHSITFTNIDIPLGE
uniref:Alpha helical protein n=1 Tax=Siphoviridae sp. ctr2f5 TaxID=2825684 RepID=A0A8S5QFS7_9CAUD|nr:MAG TPA: alpha helical protein [Siphoviridae sp. ctr2f5]